MDKNLGPAIMDQKCYVELAFCNHLSNKAMYHQLTKEEACQKMQAAECEIKSWLATHKHRISPAGLTFLECTLILKDPNGNIMFPQFYILAKLHKTPLVTCPIISVSGTLLHGFGCWVDWQLQQPGQSIPSFINSLYALTQRLCTIQEETPLPATALLFTCNVVGMYTNINTKHALGHLCSHLPGHVVNYHGEQCLSIL